MGGRGLGEGEAEDADGARVGGEDGGLAGGDEAAVFHDAAGGGVVEEVGADEGVDGWVAAGDVDQLDEGGCAVAVVPVWSAYPVADKWFVGERWQAAVARWTVADGADECAVGQGDGPGGGVEEECANDVEAFGLGLVGRPAGSRTDLRVGGEFE